MRNCTLCENKTNKLFSINMPVFMGVNKQNSKEYFNDMTFSNCIVCDQVQIDELLDLKLIYQNNHNISVVGRTWEQHYIEFSNFINKEIDNKIVLEISDPSAKIAKLLNNFKYWYIVEPNPKKIKINNVEFVQQFFDKNFNYVNSVDVIIHSHVLEHIQEPKSFFKKCNELLKDEGTMFISVPDMEYILKNNYSPNNILHFEHLYYLDSKVLEYFSNLSGFKIIDIKKYNNHSIFYKLKKHTSIFSNNIKLDISYDFKNVFDYHINNIKLINKKIEQDNEYKIYLFSAHVSSQFYLFNGLNQNKIKLILDNDTNKQDYKLYGTDLLVKNPNIIRNIKKCIVICSHVGVYYDEIKKQILELNEEAIIL